VPLQTLIDFTLSKARQLFLLANGEPLRSERVNNNVMFAQLACIVYNNIRLERIKCLRNVSDEQNR